MTCHRGFTKNVGRTFVMSLDNCCGHWSCAIGLKNEVAENCELLASKVHAIRENETLEPTRWDEPTGEIATPTRAFPRVLRLNLAIAAEGGLEKILLYTLEIPSTQ